MGGLIVVKFKLPNTKTPNEWLTLIASKSTEAHPNVGFNVVSDIRVEQATRFTDIYHLKYKLSEDLYEAHNGWD